MSTESRRLGKYELRERLASGGQGEVWKAFDPHLRRYVAIKQLHANLQSDPDFAARFEREAQFIASLHHPNIVQIHDFQLVSTSGSDTTTAYMVMDYIEGPTLADFIRNTSRKVQFPAATDIVYILTAVSLAIDYAHAKGMIHRDIKPANIILDRRSARRNLIGEPILTDFGIAKLQGVSADTTKLLGTPLYISPEQAQGLVGDKRSDLYSLGIILYEMTTGVTPFRGDSVMAILMQHFQMMPPPPALINPNIPPALSEVILKSIAKDPDARFTDASAMTIAVAEALHVPVPAELRKASAAPDISGANSHNSQPLGMAQASLTPSSLFSPPSSLTPPVNDSQTLTTTPADSRPGSVSSPKPGTNTPSGAIYQLSLLPPPAVLRPPPSQPAFRRRRKLYLALLVLLVAVVVGSGLLYTFFVQNRTTTPPSSNQVVGHARFFSSPTASSGNPDEVEITIQQIPDAQPGTQYYAWLLIHNESIGPIKWPLVIQHGSISSPPYPNTHLLANTPYLLLITLENVHTVSMFPTYVPSARLYYADLPATIQSPATFAIQKCPQGNSSNICFA